MAIDLHMTDQRARYFERMQTKLYNAACKADDARREHERLLNRWRDAIREELDSNPDAINSGWIAHHVINDDGLRDQLDLFWPHFYPDREPISA